MVEVQYDQSRRRRIQRRSIAARWRTPTSARTTRTQRSTPTTSSTATAELRLQLGRRHRHPARALEARVGQRQLLLLQSYGNFSVTQNTATTPGDYSPYCITTPVDARLPAGGGQPLCGFYDVNPNRFGQVLNLVTQASDFGKQECGMKRWANGLTGGGRLPKGGLVQGGSSIKAGFARTTATSSTSGNTTDWRARRTRSRLCECAPPWLAQLKLLAVTRCRGKDAGGGPPYQNVPGPRNHRELSASNAEDGASLGRKNLSAGANRRRRSSSFRPERSTAIA